MSQVDTYTASIGTAGDVVSGSYCDVAVNRDLPDGMFGPEQVLHATIHISINDPDVLMKVEQAADDVLREHGWFRTSGWVIADNALYTAVARMG
jgi:hypothetical protein